jgi:hypothetical protein
MAFPKIDACIVCESARPELFNKHILLGFFGITPHVRIRIKEFQKPASLCFVFCGGGGPARNYRLGLRLTDPLGATVSNPANAPDVEGELGEKRTSTNVLMGFQGLLGKPGRYRVALVVDGVEHYSTTVDIEPTSLGDPLFD